MKPDKVSPLAKEDKEKDEKGQSTLSAVLSERRFSEVSSLASLQSGICRSDDFWLRQELGALEDTIFVCPVQTYI